MGKIGTVEKYHSYGFLNRAGKQLVTLKSRTPSVVDRFNPQIREYLSGRPDWEFVQIKSICQNLNSNPIRIHHKQNVLKNANER